MKFTRLTIVATVLAALGLPVQADDTVLARICHENEDSYPWILKDRVGLTTKLLQIAEKNLGAKLDVIALPWRRCTEEAKAGLIDGIVKISFAADRAEWLAYPMSGDKPDPNKRLLYDTYSLYKIKGATNVSWDGKTLKADGTVAAQSGFSIVKQLQGLGARVDDGVRSADDNIKKVVEGRAIAVALQTEEGDASLAGNTAFSSKIEKVTPVLVEKPYFVAFAKPFYAKDPTKAKRVWDAIERARESAEYKDFVKKFK